MRIVIPAIFAVFFFFGASSRNITPDAVTRATIWNSHEGDLDVLGDGKVPQDADALPFTWKTKGILVFAWEEPLQLEKLRVYVGAIGNDYQVRAYLGGRLDETGTLREPEGVQTALIEENARAVDQWIEIYFPPILWPTILNYGRWVLRSSTRWKSTCTVQTVPQSRS